MNDLTLLGASPYNDLLIPDVMSPVALLTRAVGFGLFFLFFFGEAFRLQLDSLGYALGAKSQKPRLSKFLLRAVVLFLSMSFLYRWTFLKMVSLCDHISMLISNEEQWFELLARMGTGADVTIPLTSISVPTLISAVALTALQYVGEVFMLIRFVVLALLYCIGPMVWAFGISELGFGALRGWFKNTWQVCFWLVIYAVVRAAILPLAAQAFSGSGAQAPVVAAVYALVIFGAVFMIPSLTAAVFSDANMGAVASAAMSVVSYSAIRNAAGHGRSAHEGWIGKNAAVSSISDFLRVRETDGMGAALKGVFSPRQDSGADSSTLPSSPRTR